MQNEYIICTLKYSGTKLRCFFADGQSFDIDDTKPLNITDTLIGYLAELFKRNI